MKLGELAETSPNDILDRLGWPAEPFAEARIKIYREIEGNSFRYPSCGSNPVPVHIVSRYRLTKVLSCLLLYTGKVDADARDTEYGRKLLPWAAENGYKVIVKILLSTDKVDVNVRGTVYSWTLLL